MSNFLKCLLIGTLIGCQQDYFLEKVESAQLGITFQNTLTETDDFNILDYLYFYNGGGVAIGDINNDNLPDIFFSGNQVDNQLYLNKGNLTFENISESAGITGQSDWNTGSVMVDINHDGLLDIYVCAVVGLRGLDGANELYINNGDMTFREAAGEYGLGFDTYSSNAAFLDYDLDGDLDMYLLNHAIHSQESFGHAALRNRRNYESGDRLLRNEGGKFIDVSERAGIFGGVNGYGLGIAISDFNLDGFPDIYVGNDFHEDDYYYLNNGDGTFSEKLSDYFVQTSRFTMGCDVADVNRDGWPDLLSLDMLPEDERVLKASEGDENLNILRLRTQQYGYHYQFSRNMLQINSKDSYFKEGALIHGVAATDWSWSALFADFDHDSYQDLFISNGIPRRPNDLDYIKFVSNQQIRSTINTTKIVDQQALNMMPDGAIANNIFKGSSNGFYDKTGEWMDSEDSYATSTAVGDLDNDGDLDIVSSTVNGSPIFYINNQSSGRHLKIKARYHAQNPFGIGTRVISYHQGVQQVKELYTVRGFQGSSEPIVHFGYGDVAKVDSLRIIWPDGSTQVLKEVATNRTLEIAPTDVQKWSYSKKSASQFKKVKGKLGLLFSHQEDRYIDFDRQKLMPYQLGDRGPAVVTGDLNQDGSDDVFFGSSKFVSSRLYVSGDSAYHRAEAHAIDADSVNEEISGVFEDFDQDGAMDLLVVTGGGDFYGKRPPLLDRLYRSVDGECEPVALPEMFENGSVVKVLDYDGDGDQDVFIGNRFVTGDFGKKPVSYLLENHGGSFKVAQTFSALGMVSDATIVDLDEDGDEDIIVVGEWMSPQLLRNNQTLLEQESLAGSSLNGIYQTVISSDFDKDGDLDVLLGNWGLNSKLTATTEYPLKMYYGDLDRNGNTETIVCVAKSGAYYTIDPFDELAGQMPHLRKRFTDYKSFAGKAVEEVFTKDELARAEQLIVHNLASGYLENVGGKFTFKSFPNFMQYAPIMDFEAYDFDGDGKDEVLAGGNYFGLKPYHGRLGAFSGALIDGGNFIDAGSIGLDFLNQSVRSLDVITFQDQSYLLVTFNNEAVQLYTF